MTRAGRTWIRGAIVVAWLVLVARGVGLAQSDDCSSATAITFDANGVFQASGSTAGATDDGLPLTGIRDLPQVSDVWYQFTTPNTASGLVDVSVRVTAAGANPLPAPQFAIVTTDCVPGGVPEVYYASGIDLYGEGEAFSWAFDLPSGRGYYVAVSSQVLDGVAGGEGDFEIEVAHEDANAPEAADCATAKVICEAGVPFTADAVRGHGAVGSRSAPETAAVGDADCFTQVGGEYSPYWVKFTIDNPGDLVFAITPDDPNDDLDFALYYVGGGLDACSGFQRERCMLSGPDLGAPLSDWQNCTGSTGLSSLAGGVGESIGCDFDASDGQVDNNFLEPLAVAAGETYALLIHHSDRSGGGFTLEFVDDLAAGRPATAVTFAQPTPSFRPNFLSTGCDGAVYEFEYTGDRLPGNDTQLAWEFGPAATPAAATGPGPHRVTFASDFTLGDVFVTLTTDGTCTRRSSARPATVIEVDAGPSATQPTIRALDCDQPPTAATGEIEFAPPPQGQSFQYTLTPGDGSAPIVQTTPLFTGLPAGTYSAEVAASGGCAPVTFDDLVVDVGTPLAYDDAGVAGRVDPLACGATDASALLDDPATATENARTYLIDGVASPVTATGLAPGTSYAVTVREPGACDYDYTLAIPAAPVGPVVTAETTNAACGSPTGTLTASVTDPAAGASYEYSVDGGASFQAGATFTGLAAGAYDVVAREAGSTCASAPVVSTVTATSGPALDTDDVAVTPPSCAGGEDGALEVVGGAAGLEYSLDDGQTFGGAAAFGDLAPSDYVVVVRDPDGCQTFIPVTVPEGSPFAPAFEVTNPTCAAAGDGQITAADPSNKFEYALDEVAGGAYQASPVFGELDAGTYTLRARATSPPFCESDPATVELVPTLTAGEPLDLGAAEVTLPYGEPYELAVGDLTGLGADADYGYDYADELTCTDATCATVVLVPTSSTTLSVTALNAAGCEATGTLDVVVRLGEGVFMPTAFSPDGRGQADNETWRPRFTAAVSRVRSLRVFDRWGGLMFQQTDLEPDDDALGWDGTRMGSGEPLTADVYVAQVIADVGGRERVVTSDVTLVR